METQMGLIVLVIVVVLLFAALPTWGHSRNWGFLPSGGMGLVLVCTLVLILVGCLPCGF